MAQKPRILNNNRDMVWSLLPLVAFCLVIAGIASQCSLSTGAPKEGKIPTFDMVDALKSDAMNLPFPVRLPKVPDGWTSNSGSSDVIAGDSGGPETTVGFISPAGRYIRLTQSNAKEDTLVQFAVQKPMAATGTQSIAGQSWTVYELKNSEPVWTVDLGDVRLLITGSGSSEEFSTLASGTTSQAPLPK